MVLVYFKGYGQWINLMLSQLPDLGEVTDIYQAVGVFQLDKDAELEYKYTRKLSKISTLLPCNHEDDEFKRAMENRAILGDAAGRFYAEACEYFSFKISEESHWNQSYELRVIDLEGDKNKITFDASLITVDVYRDGENENLLNLESSEIIKEPAEKGTHSKNESAPEMLINVNEFNFSGLLNKPSTVDDWFEVIDIITSEYFNKNNKTMPSKAQAWAQLYNSPPIDYGIAVHDDKSVKMVGITKSFSYRSFGRRWKKYTDKLDPYNKIKPN